MKEHFYLNTFSHLCMKNSPYRLKKYDIISLETVSEKKERNSTLKMSLLHCAIMGISFFIRPMTEQKKTMSTKKIVNSFWFFLKKSQ